MYEDLIEKLRNNSSGFVSGDTVREAADAIEELVAVVKTGKELLEQYGGETGIKNLNEFAGKYWDTLAKIPHWISVKERLPEVERKSYWVCTDTGYQCECRWTNNRFGIGESDEWYWSIFDIPQYQNIVAWMPLPDPYKPREENGKNYVDVMNDAGLTCKACYFSKEWCNDESAICEDETGLCERFDPVD